MKKNLIERKLVSAGLVTVLMGFSSITSVLANDTVDNLMSSGSEIVISEEVSVTNTSFDLEHDSNMLLLASNTVSSNVPGATANPTNATPLYQCNDFPELRASLDELAGTKVVGGEKMGILYKGYGWDRGGTLAARDDKNPQPKGAMRNPALTNLFAENADKLTEIGAKTFADVKPSWYSQYVGPLVYYRVLSGYNEGGQLLFKGEKEISRQEWGIILAKSFYSADEAASKDTDTINLYKKRGVADWAAPYYAKVGFDISDSRKYAEGCSRQEVIYSLATTYFGDEMKAYVDKIKADPNNFVFKDIKKVIMGVEESGVDLITHAIENPDEGIHCYYYASICLMKDKNILAGTPEGNSEYGKPVKRQEAIVLLTKTMQVQGAELTNK